MLDLGHLMQQMEPSEFHGQIGSDDVATARRLADKGEYLSWEKVGTVQVHGHEVHIHRKALDNGLFEYFAHGTLPIEAEELSNMNFDHIYRLEWDDYAKTIDVVEEEHEHDGVVQEVLHWEVAFPWPMSNRDYVFRRHRSIDEDGSHVLISKGATHDSRPEASGCVRVDQLRNFMIIQKSATEKTCEFSMLYFDDLKGSIPTWLVNWAVSKAVPAFLGNLVDASKKKEGK